MKNPTHLKHFTHRNTFEVEKEIKNEMSTKDCHPHPMINSITNTQAFLPTFFPFLHSITHLPEGRERERNCDTQAAGSRVTR